MAGYDWCCIDDCRRQCPIRRLSGCLTTTRKET